MLVAQVYNDLVVGVGVGFDGVEIPENIQHVDQHLMRFDGQNIVDASVFVDFFIDEIGQKHIVNHGNWQSLQCNFADELINNNGFWRVKNANDELLKLRELQYAAIDAHILQIIKTANVIGEPADYDSLGELALYVNSNNNTYRIEAQTLITFVEACHAIQYDIKNGVVSYDSVDDAIAALPIV